MASQPWLQRVANGLAVFLVAAWTMAEGQEAGPTAGPFRVTVRDEKSAAVEDTRPVDPTPHIRFMPKGLGARFITEQGQNLHLGLATTMKIDGQVLRLGAGPGGRFEKINMPLPRSPSGQERPGIQSVYVQGDLRITLTAELVPTSGEPGAPMRSMDAGLMRYLVENKGTQAHKIGFRLRMDTFIAGNNGCLFAAPTRPGKILDGVELKGRDVPEYLQLLERPDLKNPGYVAHMTFPAGAGMDRPERLVLTNPASAIDNWDMRANPAGGDSALGVYWEVKDLRPGAKREFAYGYGRGIVPPLAGEGRFEVWLGGSFEPGKRFTVTAVVADPQPGQWLRLELPDGMEALEGRAIQPVPLSAEGQAGGTVMWKGRATRTGEFPVRIHSSTGSTQTKVIVIDKAG